MGKHKTFVVASDLHGDLQDEPTVKAFKRFVEAFNPDIRIFAGDLWDFACLRSGARDTDDEAGRSLVDDWTSGEDFITWYFNGGRERAFLGGNHDDKRIAQLQRSIDAKMRDYGNLLRKDYDHLFRSLRATVLPYCKRLGVYQLGDFRVLHGYAAGIYAARKHAQSYGNCIFGHTHAKGTFSNETLETTVAINCGCLTQLDHDYNSTHLTTLRQQHSWAYGIVTPSGTTIVNLAHEIEEGQFWVSESFKAIS
jgi:predicted phosphodiesterase